MTYTTTDYPSAVALIGEQSDNVKVPVVCIVGDSISENGSINGTACTNYHSWYGIPLNSAGIPYYGIATSGATAGASVYNLAGHGMPNNLLFENFVHLADYVVCALGANDFMTDTNQGTSYTLANLETIWSMCEARGCKTYQTTMTPQTNTSNVPNAYVPNMTALNTAIRNYYSTPLPMLNGYLDMAAATMATTNSDTWLGGVDTSSDNGTAMTADGTHPYWSAGITAMEGVLNTWLSNVKY